MAQLILTNALISINSVDLSAYGKRLAFTYNADQVDNTTFGSVGFHSRLGGLRDFSLEVDLAQDFADNQVDETLFGIVGSVVPVAFRAVNAAISASNPEYQTNALVASYQPFGQGVGEHAMARVQLVAAGTAITRDVAP